jgi:hypothetical protein
VATLKEYERNQVVKALARELFIQRMGDIPAAAGAATARYVNARAIALETKRWAEVFYDEVICPVETVVADEPGPRQIIRDAEESPQPPQLLRCTYCDTWSESNPCESCTLPF